MWVNKPKKFVDTEYPELVSLFKNRKDAHEGVSSNKIVEVICPCCQQEYKRRISDLVRAGHVTCPFCNDGFSYPEKFMSKVLNQLGIAFYYHYKSEWTGKYIYDFCFKYGDDKYILEMDGGLGHGNSVIGKTTKKQAIEIDRIKDGLAVKNGYKIIRIDCNYNCNDRFNYIKKSIIKELNSIFDLSCIDWDDCNFCALSSVFKKVVDCYKNQTKYVDEITMSTQVKERTVIKYLSDAMKYGLIEKTRIIKTNPNKIIPDDIKLISNDDTYSGRNKKIYCFEDNIIFDSITTAAKYYGFNRDSLSFAIKNHKYFKGKHFDYYDEFLKNPKSLSSTAQNHEIYQYTKDSKTLVYKYSSVNELKELHPEFLYKNIWRVCKNIRNSAYGFIWTYNEISTD